MRTDPVFKFVMHYPEKRIEDNKKETQLFHIFAKYPAFSYEIPINYDRTDEENQRLAISELKVRLIQEIANAEFEIKKRL